MSDLTRPRVTRTERHLIADILRWNRRLDATSTQQWQRCAFPGWWRRTDGTADINWDVATLRINWHDAAGHCFRSASVQVSGVTQAVEVLVALGLLPSRFSRHASTAYLDGYEAGWGDCTARDAYSAEFTADLGDVLAGRVVVS